MPAASVNIKKCQNILAFFVLLYEDEEGSFACSDREFSLLLAFRGRSPTDSHYLTTDSARFLVSEVGYPLYILYLTADLACFLVSGVKLSLDIHYMTADSACFLLSGVGSPADIHYLATDLTCFLISRVGSPTDSRYLTTDSACFHISPSKCSVISRIPCICCYFFQIFFCFSFCMILIWHFRQILC